MTSDLCHLSAATIARHVRDGEVSARAVVEAHLDRIARLDPQIHAFLEVDRDAAVGAAEAIDTRRLRGEDPGPLAGVPVAWKDNLVVAGRIASAGSRMLESYRSPFTATVIERLLQAGAVLVGRTNMDEFGMGSSTETSAFGPTLNPWQRDRVPGGSSGGSAAAVAAGFCPIALGSDTGGSVRQPAALCGVTGLKPSYGRTSRNGLIAYASSLDCVGAFARDADDLALWLDVAAGLDAADATTVDLPEEPPAMPRDDLAGLRIGVPWELNGPGLDEEVATAASAALSRLRDLGARTIEVSLPSVAHAVPAYYLIATAEAASNLARYDGVRYGLRRNAARCEAMMTASRSAGFGPEVQLRILLGTFASSVGYQDEFYGQATRARELLRADFEASFARCDVVFCPTSPVPAFPLASRIDDPLAMYLCDALTVPASLAGLPALSQPCGFTAGGLPIGMQWTAPRFCERRLLDIARTFQRHTDHHARRPSW